MTVIFASVWNVTPRESQIVTVSTPFIFRPPMSGVKLKLLCLLWPDDKPYEHIVQVEIDNDDIVASLKKLIKNGYSCALSHTDAHSLVIWKCSGLPYDDKLEQTLKNLQFDGSDVYLVRLESALEKISQHFDKNLNNLNEPIHIVVKVPPSGE